MINLTDTDVLVVAVTVLGVVAWWVSRDDNQAANTNPAVAATGAFVRSGKAFKWLAIAINLCGCAYLCWMSGIYITHLGWGAIGSAGLGVMGIYYTHVVWVARADEAISILLHTVGMFFLVSTI